MSAFLEVADVTRLLFKSLDFKSKMALVEALWDKAFSLRATHASYGVILEYLLSEEFMSLRTKLYSKYFMESKFDMCKELSSGLPREFLVSVAEKYLLDGKLFEEGTGWGFSELLFKRVCGRDKSYRLWLFTFVVDGLLKAEFIELELSKGKSWLMSAESFFRKSESLPRKLSDWPRFYFSKGSASHVEKDYYLYKDKCPHLHSEDGESGEGCHFEATWGSDLGDPWCYCKATTLKVLVERWLKVHSS